MSIEAASFGSADGKPVKRFVLKNKNGVTVKIISYGATITEIHTPDRNGKFANITTGFDSLEGYLKPNPYFGCTVGRFANRIGKATFSLDGKTYTLAKNDKANTLHGGIKAFDKVVWDAEVIEGAKDATVQFSYLSKDGEEGYPGNLKATVTYSLSDSNELTIAYGAVTDKATPVNLTNHAYFNLKGAGQGDILEHVVQINADSYTPVGSDLIPTGEIRSVEGSPMDFRSPHSIGERIKLTGPGYDHNFVLNGSGLRQAAKLSEKSTGRVMEVSTTQPGIQLYTGNFLDGTIKGLGGAYQKHGALCLETQHFPDSPNQPKFPSCILKPGETYSHKAVFKFGVE